MLKIKFNLKYLLFIIAIIYFLLFLFLNYPILQNAQFNSPDETANFFFAKQYADNLSLQVKSNFNSSVHPRSILVWNSNLVPISFPAYLVFLAIILKFSNLFILYFILFLLYIYLLYLFYLAYKDLISEKVAVFYILLFLINPVFLYYSFQFLFPQVLQLLLVLFASLFLLKNQKKTDKLSFFLFFLAILIRPLESLWIASIIFSIFLYLKRSYKEILSYMTFLFLLSAILTLIFNKLVYGSYFLFGYILPNSTSSLQTEFHFNIFLIKLKLLLKHLYYYFIMFLWPWFILFFISIIIFFKNWKKHNSFLKIYFWNFIFLSLLLIFFYAFIPLDDHVVKNMIALSNAFFRYWLIIYILSLLFIAYFLEQLYLKSKLITVLLIILLTMYSWNLVFFQGDDSLLNKRKIIYSYLNLKNLIKKELGPANDSTVLLVDREDKVFFPEYNLMHLREFKDEEALNNIQELLESSVNLYYYGFTLSNKDLQYLENEKFTNYFLVKIKDYPEYKTSLYKLELKKNEKK